MSGLDVDIAAKWKTNMKAWQCGAQAFHAPSIMCRRGQILPNDWVAGEERRCMRGCLHGLFLAGVDILETRAPQALCIHVAKLG